MISVENLSKKYAVRHQASRRGGYRRLSEELWNAAKAPFTALFKQPTPSANDARAVSSHSEDFWALDDVSFDVQRGEVVGIIGRNGAGKSTLLKILSQITEPTKGRVRLRGRVASLLEVGTGFHPELTGRENTFLYGAILGMSKEEVRRKFDEIVAFAEIDKFVDTPVKRYSSGMYMRLAFSVAAQLEPDILLVDEVLAVGDSAFQKKCLGKMKSVTGEGRTVLFVSHNMAAIESLCSRCLLLDRGSKDCEGRPDDVIRRYMGLSNAACSGAVDFGPETRERFGPREFAVLHRLGMNDGAGNPLRTVRMGESVEVRLDVEFKQSGPGFEIGIAVVNMHGVSLHYFVSPWEGLHEVSSPGLKTIEVQIPAIYLFPGSYFLSVWVKRQGSGYDDAVHEALGFDVEEAALTAYPNYFARYSHNSQVYSPSHWRFVEQSRLC